MLPSAGKPSQSFAMGASSPAIGASSPAMAPEVDAQGTSLEHSATSPEMGVISPVMASLPPATGAISPVMAPLSSATGVNSPAMAPPSPVRAPASTFNPPSSEVGAISPAKASNSLNASVSPATAPTAAGGLPGSSNEADWRAVAWASFLSAQSAQPASAWTAAMAPPPESKFSRGRGTISSSTAGPHLGSALRLVNHRSSPSLSGGSTGSSDPPSLEKSYTHHSLAAKDELPHQP
eukprot:CAMPEP_0174693428 /NCGR_PEP_ID=MMETSP1094-20130205/27_1 /TAXON_ID=156173 /ORGANISM="Chrysochromulina brevifilum, Strain UTEX LB 985" /LENGTH=235 /DNA_ID=CAMNT_0015889331 /DNA_START=905 /DNA_END=1613 /DNA_ORIENTATION=-